MRLRLHAASMVAAICLWPPLAPHADAADDASPNKAVATVKVVDADEQDCRPGARPITAAQSNTSSSQGLAVSFCVLKRHNQEEPVPDSPRMNEPCFTARADQDVAVEVVVGTEENFALSLSSVPLLGECPPNAAMVKPSNPSARPASDDADALVLTVEF